MKLQASVGQAAAQRRQDAPTSRACTQRSVSTVGFSAWPEVRGPKPNQESSPLTRRVEE